MNYKLFCLPLYEPINTAEPSRDFTGNSKTEGDLSPTTKAQSVSLVEGNQPSETSTKSQLLQMSDIKMSDVTSLHHRDVKIVL